ncbi:hypothetical protein [Embleya sp. NBC_00896]|uniref:hypothetical protein n=1 Tax=Embleya sp. NBC_00896 TaxID=2975961 RepID=UPI00386BE289|nr:hypothetical protein OG928_25680 [Embleya sp. NBC_00896]
MQTPHTPPAPSDPTTNTLDAHTDALDPTHPRHRPLPDLPDLPDLPESTESSRPSDPTLRRRLAWLAVIACSPYLTLKLLWIVGIDVGVVDPGELDRAQWVTANVLTFGMDAVAALIAHALTRPREVRARAWLITVPLWVASGLLAVIMLAVPLSLMGVAFTGTGNPFAGDEFLRPWVFAVVYGGFIAEGAVLLGAFGLYAHERWATLLRTRVRALPDPAGTRDVQRFLGTAAAVLLAVTGALRLAWALGADFGMSRQWIADRDAIGQWLDGSLGGLSLAGAAGLLMLVHRVGGPRTLVRTPLVMAWFGTGTAFAWSGLIGVSITTSGPDTTAGRRTSELLRLVYNAELIAGVLALTVGWFVLSEFGKSLTRTAGRDHPTRSTVG